MFSELIKSLLIAIVQGLTEWFPISSSGHLVLAEKLLNFKGGIIFDVAVHFGTLMAVFVYFGEDIIEMIKEIFRWNFKSEKGKLALLILTATIPGALAGYFFEKYFEMAFNSLIIVALGFAITGLILIIASLDFRIVNSKKKKFGIKKAFLVGVAQALALFPGISRSGTTISSSLLLGLDEKNAMKFSFLMSIPIIFGATILEIGNKRFPPDLFWATLASFIVGLITIHLLFRYVLSSKKNLRYFAIYTLALSILIFIFVLVF